MWKIIQFIMLFIFLANSGTVYNDLFKDVYTPQIKAYFKGNDNYYKKNILVHIFRVSITI